MDEYSYYFGSDSPASGSSGSGSSGPTLLDYLNLGGKTATGVLGALNQPKPATKPGATNWALIGGIVAAVIGVLLLVMVAGGGRRGR